MKLLNDLKLQFEKELWALNPELAVMDTILNQHPEIIEMVKVDITKGKEASEFGRQETPTVEQIVRAASYKEMKNLSYRGLSLRSTMQGCVQCSASVTTGSRFPLQHTRNTYRG